MSTLLEKISSYQIVNYLFPGICFVWLSDSLSLFKIPLFTDRIIENFFIYYFIGMLINRIGSLIIEPFLRYIKFILFSKYEDYIEAEKYDKKISILSEINNNFRSLTSMSFIILLCFLYNNIANNTLLNYEFIKLILILSIFIIFLLSYKKQTKYIKNRVDFIKSNTKPITG